MTGSTSHRGGGADGSLPASVSAGSRCVLLRKTIQHACGPGDETIRQEQDSNIYERVREKKASYRQYNLERWQEEAFATFFDLAQEYTSVESLLQISVAVVKEFVCLDSRIHTINPKTRLLEMVCSTEQGLIPPEKRKPSALSLENDPYSVGDSLVFPLRGNRALARFFPIHKDSAVLGLFEVPSRDEVNDENRFFLEKFSNRIGYNLHQKLLLRQHLNHIRFINQLVSDIEHNVISPNMYYKLFLLRMKRNLDTYGQVGKRLREAAARLSDRDAAASGEIGEICRVVEENNRLLTEEWKAFSKHYEHTSLFLESLFRRDHFEKGTYVLRKQPCNFRTEIIEPLLERYLPMLEKRGVAVDSSLLRATDEQITLFVDKGLISQVFDNFFSNAVKYTGEVEDEWGNTIKLLSYDRQMLKDYFGEGIHGVRFNFFTTGKPLSEEDARRIFEEGYRGETRGNEQGTGHGLHFVRSVVEIHGGVVGCEPQMFGNLIYFILPVSLPMEVREEPPASCTL